MLREVPPNCTVVGVPGRIVKRNDVRVTWNTMDQIHLPDPVFDDIETLKKENTELTNRVLELERELKFMKKRERLEVSSRSDRMMLRLYQWKSGGYLSELPG